MHRSARTIALCFCLAACSAQPEGAAETATVDRDTLTRRQRDSIIADMPIPQAGAVGNALGASDAAAERARQLDEELGR